MRLLWDQYTMAFPRVSDLKRFTGLSKRPFTLLLTGIAVLIASVVFGRIVAPRIDMQISSVAFAFALVCVQGLLILLAGYLLAMAVAVFTLGKAWRDRYLVPYTPANSRDPEAYLARIGDRTLAFWIIVITLWVLSTLGVHFSTEKYLLSFPVRGYHLVSFRGEGSIGKIRGMREIVGRDLSRHLDPDDFRERVRVHLNDEDQDVRAQAAWMVGRLQLVSLETSVRTLLRHPDAQVRAQAAIAEGQLRTAKGIEALGEALQNERDEDVVEAILVGIGMARNTELAEDIAQNIETFSEKNRPFALWAVGESDALCAAREVIKYTDERYEHETRCAAMESMKKIGTTDQIDALREIFKGEDVWCELRVWRGRSSHPIKRDFYRMTVSAERIQEKALDSLFNIAGPGLKEDLATIINDKRQEWLNRKHARRLYDLLDPGHPRTPRNARNCEFPPSNEGAQ